MRGIERQADYYGFVAPEVAEQAARVEANAALPTDADVADLVHTSGVGIQAGMLREERGPSFSRGHRFAAVADQRLIPPGQWCELCEYEAEQVPASYIAFGKVVCDSHLDILTEENGVYGANENAADTQRALGYSADNAADTCREEGLDPTADYNAYWTRWNEIYNSSLGNYADEYGIDLSKHFKH